MHHAQYPISYLLKGVVSTWQVEKNLLLSRLGRQVYFFCDEQENPQKGWRS